MSSVSLFVGSPILILSSSVIIANWSFCIHEITCHNPGFLWPTSLLKALFHDSQTLFVLGPSSSVTALTFHLSIANLGECSLHLN